MLTKFRLWSVICLTVFMVSCAGSSGYMKPSSSLLSPTADKALVRFMRPSGMGYAINFNIWDGERVIGNSVAKSQFDYLAEPGKHLFVAIAENVVYLDADLEAGKTYYVLTQVKMGAWKARVGFVPVTRGSEWWDKMAPYENELAKLQPDMDVIKKWEDANKGKIKEVVAGYDAAKNAGQLLILKPEDGR